MIQASQKNSGRNSGSGIKMEKTDSGSGINTLKAEELSQMASAALATPVTMVSAPSCAVPVSRPEAQEAPERPVPVQQLTLEQAKLAAQPHSKRRVKGCSECMGQWFLPQYIVRGSSQQF